jgi:hypothetical protein
MNEPRIKAECSCNFGFVETGLGGMTTDIPNPVNNRKLFQIISPSGRIVATNRDDDEEMDDLNLRCIRCGSSAWWE